MRVNKDIVQQKHDCGRRAGLIFHGRGDWRGWRLGVDGGKGALDRVRDGLEVLGAHHRNTVQRHRVFLLQLVLASSAKKRLAEID